MLELLHPETNPAASARRVLRRTPAADSVRLPRLPLRRIHGLPGDGGRHQVRDSIAQLRDMLGEDGNPAAGVCHARGVNLGLPPVWMIYLPVGDLAKSIHRVGEEGGKIIKATRGNDGEYASAVIQDLVGAHLALVPS